LDFVSVEQKSAPAGALVVILLPHGPPALGPVDG